MKLCFATNNLNKIKEVKKVLNTNIEIVSLQDLNCQEELPENQKTLEGNSHEKADYVYKKYGVNCFADDTGLEVYALDGEPGVYSARYGGAERSSQKNIGLLLDKLALVKDRGAQFRTVITLIVDGKAKQFEGVVKGDITEQPFGAGGFGYDPIFIPKQYKMTFAEMGIEEKNEISHRGIAIQKLSNYLKKHFG